MRRAPQGSFWRCMVLVAGIVAVVLPAAKAKESPASVKTAEQYIANGNLKAAEIELRNAVREAPQDPVHPGAACDGLSAAR